MGWDDTTLPLRLRRVRVITVLENTPTRLKAEIRSGWSVSRRPPCGHKCRRVHDTRPRPVRDMVITGRRMTLVWQRRRFVCDDCGARHLESHPDFEGNPTRRPVRPKTAKIPARPKRPGSAGLPAPASTAKHRIIQAAQPPPRSWRRPSPNPMYDRRALQNRAAVFAFQHLHSTANI